MRIQFFGDAAGTGFGTVTRELGRALLAIGEDVRFVSQNEVGDDWEFRERTFEVTREFVDLQLAEEVGLTTLAMTTEGVLKLIRGEAWADGWRPDAAIILGDYASVERLVLNDEATVAAFRSLPTYHYVPIEGVDLPPAWRVLWSVLRPVAMCQAGADQIARVMGTRPPVAYHGVNTDSFWPVSPDRPIYLRGDNRTYKLRSKAECKRFFGGDPRSKWVLRTDRFMPRKRYGSLLRSMAPVLASHPDTMLMMHCRSRDEGGNLYNLISKYPREIAARMLISGFHDRLGGAPVEILNTLYNAADVYASCSAEGFGLTIAEAMACGVPAVGMDYASVTEVIGPGGLLAPINRLDDNEYDYAWATVDEPKFGSLVAQLLDNDIQRRDLGRKAVEHIRSFASWATAARQFVEAMTVQEMAA